MFVQNCKSYLHHYFCCLVLGYYWRLDQHLNTRLYVSASLLSCKGAQRDIIFTLDWVHSGQITSLPWLYDTCTRQYVLIMWNMLHVSVVSLWRFGLNIPPFHWFYREQILEPCFPLLVNLQLLGLQHTHRHNAVILNVISASTRK